MSPIKTVAIFGASGNIGPYIVNSLLNSGFDVTIIRRVTSTATYPAGVTVKETDFTFKSLQDVLSGQDAVVSCIAGAHAETELRIINMAEAMGVQRFIPSEYGADMHGKAIPEYTAMQGGKKKVLEHLVELASSNNNFTWTSLIPGPFFDYFLYATPLLAFHVPSRKAIIYDSGNEPWTGTTLESVANAVTNILLKPAETANRVMRTISLQTTQNEVLAALESASGKQWDVQRVSAEATKQRGLEHLKAEKYVEAYSALFASQLWEDGKGRGITVAEEDSDNLILGVETERLEDIIENVIANNS